jgi:cytochrome c oxidase subunit 2
MGKLFGAAVVLITLVSAAFFATHTWWLPANASAAGAAIDRQMEHTMIWTGALFIAGQVVLALFAFSSRNRDSKEKTRTFPGGAVPLVIAAMVVVGVEIFALTFVGSKAWAAIYLAPADADAIQIDVQAQQFAFYFHYAGPDGRFGAVRPDKIDDGNGNYVGLDPVHDAAARDDIVSSMLVVPVNRPIALTLHSRDVGHSFFVRELRVQQDFVPGLDVRLQFTATQTGQFEIVCTQLCGWGHYRMKAYVRVVEPAEYDAWLESHLRRVAAVR